MKSKRIDEKLHNTEKTDAPRENEIFGFTELTDERIKKGFGNSLKELRSHLGITQIVLEEATQIPRQSLSVYERGEILPTISQAYKITRFFRLSIEDFIVYGLNEQKRLLQENFRDITEKYDSIVKI